MKDNKHEAHYTMIDWYKKVLTENYANFDGRARRSEYWYFFLTNILIIMGLYSLAIIGLIADIPAISIVGGGLVLIYVIIIFIPCLAVAVRRLHDTNKSGAFILLAFIPILSIVLLVFYAIEGDLGENQYGNDPKS